MINVGDGFPTHVLIVDDRERVREPLRARIAISSPSYLVDTVESGSQALARLAADTFDVVLCDLRLRGDMDGVAVTREIGRRYPEVRVVVFSGQDEGQSKIDVLNAGAYSYLSKPINHDELLHAIRTINSIRRTERLHKSFQLLARISYELQASFDFDFLAERVVDGACALGHARARLYLFDHEHKTLVGKASRGGPSGIDFEHYVIPFEASPMIARIFAQDRPTFWNKALIVEHFGQDGAEPWVGDLQLDEATWLDCPLLVGKRRIGTLAVDDLGRGRPYTEADRQIMGVFSGLAAQALHNSRLYEREALAKASLQSILRDAPDVVITTDLAGCIDFVSPSSEPVLGFLPSDLVGRQAHELYTDEQGSEGVGLAVARAVMHDLYAAGTIANRKLYLRSPEGRARPISLSGSLLHDERKEAIGTLGFLKDLSPIEAQTQEYRDVLEGFGYGTLLLSKRGIIGFVNRKAARLFRQSRSELLGKSFRDMVLPSQHGELDRGLEAVLREDAEVQLDLSLLQRDQRRLPIKATLTAVKTRRSLSGVAVALYDKSELGALIRSGRLMALGQMIAGVAHEINNPLNHILLAAREIEEDLGSHDPQILADYFTMIQRNGRRIRQIVDQLREFAKPTEFSRQPISLNAVVHDALTFFATRFRNNDIALIEDLAADLPPILGDASRLQQVLVNLVVNAEEAMEDQIEPKEVRVATRRISPERVLLTISDTGSGIPEAIKEAIFDPFFTTKPPSRGTGLGLSISRSIIDLHDGTISVDRRVADRGTRFHIELPCARGWESGARDRDENVDRGKDVGRAKDVDRDSKMDRGKDVDRGEGRS